MDHAQISQILSRALGDASRDHSFLPLLDGLRAALTAAGVTVDRLQLPMSRALGFRHPTYGLVILEWNDAVGYTTSLRTHAELGPERGSGARNTPFEGIIRNGDSHLMVADLQSEPQTLPALVDLQSRGYRGYLALGLPLPTGNHQPIAVCSRAPFPPDLPAHLDGFRATFGLAIYAAIRTSQAVRVSMAYIGREAGPRVLEGEIQRGSTQRLEAGIVFCDIRGFTALSERVGPETVVRVVNDVFAVVGEAAESRGGEILKFIGDAMLVIFPVSDSRTDVARAMVETARESLAGVEALDCDIHIGFGGHIGEVVQGNIGTPNRLDFTVMGSAVNLASRLESLCKTLNADAVFSDTVALEGLGLVPAGPQSVKGVAEPVETFTL